MKRNEEIEKLIGEASTIFKEEASSNYSKFKFLPEWVNAEAKYFQSERQIPIRNYKVYQRGALVMVDFGVGIGGELSGNHFAVVLNKNDSPKNRVLTVIPISSKSNRFTVEIDGLIRDKSQKIIQELQHKLEQDFSMKQAAFDAKEQVFIDEIDNFYYMEIQHLFKLNSLNLLFQNYERFNKKSYAKCLDITTISKDRIIYLNKYDPCGKIKVSNDTLTKIDTALKHHFIID